LAGKKVDTRAVGLDVGLAMTRWLTGAENLHYGLWDGLEVNAGNVGAAQMAYTDKLFTLLPDGPGLRILDIGGGAGETAKKLLALGHEVEIVIPSAFLAQRCRENAVGATVHEMRFEEFETERRFDVCLFSESFQYIPYEVALDKAAALLAPGGRIVVADCFRTPEGMEKTDYAKVGGGHGLSKVREALAARPLDIRFEEDITDRVAPSVEVEQDFYNALGYAATRVDEALSDTQPVLRGMLHRLLRLFLSKRRRARLAQRVFERTRTAEMFRRYNRYMMFVLTPKD